MQLYAIMCVRETEEGTVWNSVLCNCLHVCVYRTCLLCWRCDRVPGEKPLEGAAGSVEFC